MSVDAYIPEDYIPTAQQKMTLYRRIASVQSLEEVKEITQEINDRFGAPPRPVRRLLKVMGVRTRAADYAIKNITAARTEIKAQFTSPRYLSAKHQGRLQQALGNAVTFSFATVPTMRIALEKGRQTNPGIECGICGEHGGDPQSIVFCHKLGIDYVSCSPFRIRVARLAAAQAALKNPNGH